MKVIISAGGTGGHIYPALAIVDKIIEKDKNAEFLYIGTTNRMEKDIIPERGLPFFGIEVYGLKRSFKPKDIVFNIKAVFKYLNSMSIVKKKIKEFNPDIVIGAGGYVTAPVIKMAKKLGYKTLVHEQNSILGLSNKMNLKYTDTLCTSFKNMKVDKCNYVYTGNPTSDRAKMAPKLDLKELGIKDTNKKTVIIVMGSLGSMTVSNVLKESLTKFDNSYNTIIITGKDYYESYLGLEKGENVYLFPYMNNFSSVMKSCDLMVTRAGASTISEIVSTLTPVVFVPSPYVTENHQYKNAMSLVNEGAALILEEKDLTVDSLVKIINDTLSNEDTIKNIKKNLSKFEIDSSSEKIYNEIIKLIKE
ncbi:MAG: undecaprenyldiphospho-muramoylpentapeptide beta-N-acetylglucosaminyltransferase [Bacilli bacterium]|nr:undecaprenyldiphospho-muramoylpentapeptide beta-N-acetylglucosaminyltransferase [Bacilli bacterium]